MPSRKKIDLQKVLACLNTTCPKCGRVIEPQEIATPVNSDRCLPMMAVIVSQPSTTMIPESRPSGLPQKTQEQSLGLRSMVDALSLKAHAREGLHSPIPSECGPSLFKTSGRFFAFNGLSA